MVALRTGARDARRSTGEDAVRAAGALLPLVNPRRRQRRAGAARRRHRRGGGQPRRAVLRSAARDLAAGARSSWGDPRRRSALKRVPVATRLALEMATHEESERARSRESSICSRRRGSRPRRSRRSPTTCSSPRRSMRSSRACAAHADAMDATRERLAEPLAARAARSPPPRRRARATRCSRRGDSWRRRASSRFQCRFTYCSR